MSIIISGLELANNLNEKYREVIENLLAQGKRAPQLSVIIVGDNPASRSYVKSKVLACERVSMIGKTIELPIDISEEELLKVIKQENQDTTVDGILVQLPLPAHINKQKVIETIAIEKDVDGFHPYNVGLLYTEQDTFIPCTPLGILKMIKSVGYDVKGKAVTVIGSSLLVGTPLAFLLSKMKATVTICHSATKNTQELARQADLLVVATGRHHLVKKDWVKPGAFVIDVGINRTDAGKIEGDVDFEQVKELASYITPVPKGVGPMTVNSLIFNTLKAYHLREGLVWNMD